MAKKENNSKQLIDSVFLNKTGKKVKVSNIIKIEDCWFLKNKNAWIITNKGVKAIAKEAGISKNYTVEESATISPDYRNELEHVVRVTIKCNAKKKKGAGCVHSDEDTLTVTGEANRVNTPNRGRGFLRKMAEKRAYDIAVLEHLDLYSSVFSEEEATDFEQKPKRDVLLMPGTQEFERINVEINALLNSNDAKELKKVGRKIKAGIKQKKYSEKQIEYLRILYRDEMGKKDSTF
jgi:hypothetical protein